MKKYIARFILILILLSLLIPFLTIQTHGSTYENEATNIIVIQELITYPEFQYIEQNTSNNCLKKIEQCNSYIAFLIGQNHPNSTQEISRIENIKIQYELDYETLLAQEEEQAKWDKRLEEYPEATKIWKIMKEEFQWEDTVCAGIMGNMMAEVAGGTLYALDRWNTDKSSGYGLIQWVGQRRKDIKNIYGSQPSIEEQLYFMRDELFGTNGVRKQVTDAQLDAIMNADSPEEVAYNFAVYFERCADWARDCRRGYARIAYNYFVD